MSFLITGFDDKTSEIVIHMFGNYFIQFFNRFLVNTRSDQAQVVFFLVLAFSRKFFIFFFTSDYDNGSTKRLLALKDTLVFGFTLGSTKTSASLNSGIEPFLKRNPFVHVNLKPCGPGNEYGGYIRMHTLSVTKSIYKIL